MRAESYPGTSLIVAYCPCIAHGVDLADNNLRQQDLAVRSGQWPLLCHDPRRAAAGSNPLDLDSAEPSIPYRDYALTEVRFNVLRRTPHPEASERLLRAAQAVVYARYRHYAELASLPVGPKEEGSNP